MTLYGPAGVGKSRLLAEVVQRLPQTLLLRGRCLPYGEEITYWPLAEAAKAHAGILDTDPAGTALAKLRHAVAAAVPEPRTWSPMPPIFPPQFATRSGSLPDWKR